MCVSACALSRTRVERGAKRYALVCVCVCVHVLSVTGEAEVDFNSEVLFIQRLSNSARVGRVCPGPHCHLQPQGRTTGEASQRLLIAPPTLQPLRRQ